MKGTDTETPRALDAADARFRFFLLYGPDEAGSVALARRLERAMGADAERIDLESPELKSDPSRLADEAASISLSAASAGSASNLRPMISSQLCRACSKPL